MFANRVKRVFVSEGDPGTEFCKFYKLNRNTKKKIPSQNTSTHKSVIKAINKAQSCQIKTMQLPKENKTHTSKSTTLSQTTLKATHRRALGSIQLEQRTTLGDGLTGRSAATVSKPAQSTLHSSHPFGGSQAKANKKTGLSGPTSWQARREQWLLNKLRIPPPPPPSEAPRQYMERLVRRKLNIGNFEPSFSSQDDENYFFANVCVTPERAAEICLASASQSSSDIRARERKTRFTASKCYSLLTPKQSIEDNEFWEGKLNSVLNSSFTGNFNTDRGLEDEAFARHKYEAVYKTPVETLGFVIRPDLPWLGCSPDGIIGQRILFETKSPESGIFHTARDVVKNLPFIKIEKDGLKLSKRHLYYGQVQLNMALTGVRECHFVVYSSFDCSIAVVDVPFDGQFVDTLLD